MEETRTSCMVVCGPARSNVAPSSSNRSLIPRRLFGEEEGGSRTMVAEGSRTTRSEETTKPEPPCVTEDTEAGRMNRTKAWVADAATQDIGWETDGELMYQDQDVRLKEPERTDSHVTPASQRRSDASKASRRIEVQSRDRGEDPKWLNRTQPPVGGAY